MPRPSADCCLHTTALVITYIYISMGPYGNRQWDLGMRRVGVIQPVTPEKKDYIESLAKGYSQTTGELSFFTHIPHTSPTHPPIYSPKVPKGLFFFMLQHLELLDTLAVCVTNGQKGKKVPICGLESSSKSHTQASADISNPGRLRVGCGLETCLEPLTTSIIIFRPYQPHTRCSSYAWHVVCSFGNYHRCMQSEFCRGAQPAGRWALALNKQA